MKPEKLPIIRFSHRKIDEQRTEGRGDNTPPKWLLPDEMLIPHSKKLLTEFQSFSNQFSKRMKDQSTVPFVFLVKLFEKATAKSRRAYIVDLFQDERKNSIIGLVDTDKLLVKLDSSDHDRTIQSKINDYQSNRRALSCIESFLDFSPILYKSEEESSCSYKVKLIDYQDYELNLAIQRQFEQTLQTSSIEFNKTLYTSQLPIYKVGNIASTVLDSFQHDDTYDMIFSIEPMPRYTISLDSLSQDSDIAILTPKPDVNYKTLGILDSGIAGIPHIAPWLSEKSWSPYPSSAINKDHGTFIAGIALYGDTCEEHDWIGHSGIKLFDATVVPDTSKEGLEEDELIHNIQEAITANQTDVKIWNISISITHPVKDNRFSDFALALDDLQDRYNILICKSTGNCDNFLHGKPKGRIYEGADSVRSLVVGSLAHKKGLHDISDIDNPSPFTRIGPGPEFIIKPEVSHYGGNAGIFPNGKLSTTGVTSFTAKGNLATDCGTSFSTPRIASLATGLYQKLDSEFDPLLLKALIIHSASYSKNLKIPETERSKQLGFGVPKNIQEILFNDPYEVTLILRETLYKGHFIDIMDFPMPQGLIRDGLYTGQVIATLVYEPILDATQGPEYCQSNIDIKFGSYDEKASRDISKPTILNPVGHAGAQNLLVDTMYSRTKMRSNQDSFALKERLLIKYADKYYPVKKYAVDFNDMSDTNKHKYLTQEKLWYLQLKGLYRNHTEQKAAFESRNLSQELCLVMTIRDPEKQVAVYDAVTQALDLNNFWHDSIRLTSEVSVSV